VHSDSLRRFVLLANSAEKRDQAEAEAIHGQCRTDPCQRCAIERLGCSKRRQARPLFRSGTRGSSSSANGDGGFSFHGDVEPSP
jgi:hypothetical protein